GNIHEGGTFDWTRLRGPSERPALGAVVPWAWRKTELFSLTPAFASRYGSRAGMALTRLPKEGAILVASLLLVLTAAPGAVVRAMRPATAMSARHPSSSWPPSTRSPPPGPSARGSSARARMDAGSAS